MCVKFCKKVGLVTVNDVAMSTTLKLKAAVQYAVNRSGHLSNAGIYAGALVRTDPRLEQPDLQINMSLRQTRGFPRHPVLAASQFCGIHNGLGSPL